VKTVVYSVVKTVALLVATSAAWMVVKSVDEKVELRVATSADERVED